MRTRRHEGRSGCAAPDATLHDRTLERLEATRESKPSAVEDAFASHVGEIRRLYAAGEIDAALDLALAVRTRATGFSLDLVPTVTLTLAQLIALPLDARSGRLLARIDGRSTLQTLLDVSPMSASDTIAVVEELLALGAIRLVPPAPTCEPATALPRCAPADLASGGDRVKRRNF